MPRVLSLYLPHWAAERVRRRSGLRGRPGSDSREKPVLLTGADRGRQVVRKACSRGLSGGVRDGMTLAHARAALGRDALVVDEDPAAASRVTDSPPSRAVSTSTSSPSCLGSLAAACASAR